MNSKTTPPLSSKKEMRFTLRKLTAQQQFLILITAFVVLSVAIILFVILPAVKDIIYLNKQITLYKTELERKYQERFNVRQTINDLKNARNLLSVIESSFIPKDGEIDFVEFLEKIADKYALKQQLEFRVNSNKNKFLTPFNLALTLEGDYYNILKYIEELEKQNIYINFKEILMTQQRTFTAHLKGTVWQLN